MSSHAATAGAIDHHSDPTTTTGIPHKKLLMWAFLASDCMFFGTLISTHLVYRLNPPPGNAVATQVFNIELTSFSTFILLMSSLMMALAVNAIQRGNVPTMRSALLTTIVFGLIFLGGQIYEFTHFVREKHMTLSNSIFGSTFYTLTGTHGTHVAIGVFWLALMYVRSFKPADADQGRPWLLKNVLHVFVFLITVAAAMATVLGLVHALQGEGLSAGALAHFGRAHVLPLVGTVGGLFGLNWLARSSGPVDFAEHNANDVETMGLYWHFVDIVWIIIFTAVYLLEYV